MQQRSQKWRHNTPIIIFAQTGTDCHWWNYFWRLRCCVCAWGRYRVPTFWLLSCWFNFWRCYIIHVLPVLLQMHHWKNFENSSLFCDDYDYKPTVVLCARKCGGAFAGTTSVHGWTSRAVLWAYRRCLACVSHIAAVTSTRTPDSRSRSPSHTSSDTSAPQPAFIYYSLPFAPSLTSICCCGLVYLRNWGWICTS